MKASTCILYVCLSGISGYIVGLRHKPLALYTIPTETKKQHISITRETPINAYTLQGALPEKHTPFQSLRLHMAAKSCSPLYSFTTSETSVHHYTSHITPTEVYLTAKSTEFPLTSWGILICY